MSCDWWRAGHVTTVLSSDWSRLPIELEVVQFSEHRGLTLASLRVNMSESHFDNDLVFETEFEKIVEKYDNYNGPDVFGRTFKRYSKSRWKYLNRLKNISNFTKCFISQKYL